MCWEEEKGLHIFKSDYVDINFIYLFYTKGQEHNGEAPAHQPDPDLPHVTNAAMSSRAALQPPFLDVHVSIVVSL